MLTNPRIQIFDLKVYSDLEPQLGSLTVIRTDTYRSATYDFLLTFHGNHGPISYSFRDKRRFQWKIAKYSHTTVFCAPLKGSSWNLARPLGNKKKLDWRRYRAEKEVWRYFQPSGYNTRTWQTDGQTDIGRQQRPRLRIASRGKNANSVWTQLYWRRMFPAPGINNLHAWHWAINDRRNTMRQLMAAKRSEITLFSVI